MKKALLVAVVAVLMLALLLPSGAIAAITEDYGDVTLSGGFQAGHFPDIWDLTQGDITISFTYDANGLVDDFGGGAHAWAELGVRSMSCTTVDLLADQDINVGYVQVCGDGDILTVEYVITEPGWVITQTHLAVADSLAGIPQTKKGNPKVGQFDYSLSHEPPVTSYAYPPIDVSGLGDPLYIAAHAKVVRPVDDCWETVWQIGEVETDDGTGKLTNYCDELNYDYFYEGLGVVNPDYTDPFFAETTPDAEFPWISIVKPPYGPYATDISVQWSDGLPLGGELTVSWSPGSSGASETKIVTSVDNGETQTFSYSSGWTDPNGWRGYPLVESTLELDPLAGGSHELRLQHTAGDGAIWDWIRLEKPCEEWESAWGDGLDFPGNNWATYFPFTPTISDFNPTWQVEGSGVWLATDYDWTANTFDPDPVGSPTQDIDDKLILQKGGGCGEGGYWYWDGTQWALTGGYNLPSIPPNPGANHRVWFDRDGVDQWQAMNPLAVDGGTYNTGGTYDVVITLHANDSNSGTAYMTVNGLAQGFETDGNWKTMELTPAGMTFTGDMEHLQVFYGLYGYGATHTVDFTDITVQQ